MSLAAESGTWREAPAVGGPARHLLGGDDHPRFTGRRQAPGELEGVPARDVAEVFGAPGDGDLAAVHADGQVHRRALIPQLVHRPHQGPRAAQRAIDVVFMGQRQPEDDGEGVVDGGETKILLQIFSKTVIGPIFFEFIQRKGDDGFGEGNFKALFESIEQELINSGELIA